jgi:hypothetical protein
VTKRYLLEKREITYFTVTVYADSPEEALELAEDGQYDDEHADETEIEIGRSFIADPDFGLPPEEDES